MTRRKKSRKSGPLAPSNRPTQLVRAERKQLTDGKNKQKQSGNKAGSRQQVAAAAHTSAEGGAQPQDPRLGSKKPIDLSPQLKPEPVVTPAKVERQKPAQTPEQALLAFEAQPRFIELLDKADADALAAAEQQELDQLLSQHSALLDAADAWQEQTDDQAVSDAVEPAQDDIWSRFNQGAQQLEQYKHDGEKE